jgi:hypothetical protein
MPRGMPRHSALHAAQPTMSRGIPSFALSAACASGTRMRSRACASSATHASRESSRPSGCSSLCEVGPTRRTFARLHGPVVCCMLSVVCCMLSVVCCMLRAACRVQPARSKCGPSRRSWTPPESNGPRRTPPYSQTRTLPPPPVRPPRIDTHTPAQARSLARSHPDTRMCAAASSRPNSGKAHQTHTPCSLAVLQ